MDADLIEVARKKREEELRKALDAPQAGGFSPTIMLAAKNPGALGVVQAAKGGMMGSMLKKILKG